MTNRREGREGREREGERDRERGSRAKPGIQLVILYKESGILRIMETNTEKEKEEVSSKTLTNMVVT